MKDEITPQIALDFDRCRRIGEDIAAILQSEEKNPQLKVLALAASHAELGDVLKSLGAAIEGSRVGQK